MEAASGHSEDRESVDGGDHGGHGQLSPALKQETCIVFDWDDTILPTSWLERQRALAIGGPPRPDIIRQLSSLCSAATQTLNLASQMGTVLIITNSAPGWLDQSCQLFMPQIHQLMRQFPVFAKPMHAPITFKIGAFRRECNKFRNIVSIGDGDAERAATLRLQMPATRAGGDRSDVPRWAKSLKLLETPTCQQLIVQHEMLQNRLADVVGFQRCLDLKVKLPVFGASHSEKGGCTLVHFGRPQVATPLQQQRSAPAPIALENSPSRNSPHANRARDPLLGALPPLGRVQASHGADMDFVAQVPRTGRSVSEGEPTDSNTVASNVVSSNGGVDAVSANGGKPPESHQRVGDDSGDIGNSALANAGFGGQGNMWKPQGFGLSQGKRSLSYGANARKHKSALALGLATRNTGSMWREHSAPAGARGL